VSIPLLLLAQLLPMSTTQLLVVCCWCVLPARPTPISLCLRFKFLFTSTVEAATSSAVEAAVTAGRGDSSYSSPGPLSPPFPHFCLLSPPSTCRPECRLARIQEWEKVWGDAGCVGECDICGSECRCCWGAFRNAIVVGVEHPQPIYITVDGMHNPIYLSKMHLLIRVSLT
jgi:hypothetical protein